MAARIGNIEAFDAKEETWTAYCERFELFVICNSIEENKKASTLLTIVGAKTYNLIRNLCTPTLPSNKTYQQIVELVKNHLQPAPSEIAERYKFNQLNQKEGESIADYLAKLKQASTYCNFGANLNNQLRDRLVSGIRSDRLRQILLSERELTLDRALTKATAHEAALRDSQVVGQERSEEGNKMQYSNKKGKKYGKKRNDNNTQQKKDDNKDKEKAGCSACGRSNHKFEQCRYKEFTCHNCGQKGHLRYRCKESNSSSSRKGNEKFKQQSQHYLEQDKSFDDDGFIQLYCMMGKGVDGSELKRKIIVENQQLEMELDTGSQYSGISTVEFRRRFPHHRMNRTSLVLQDYTKNEIRPRGVIQVELEYGGRRGKGDLYVFDKGGPALMGRDWLYKLGIIKEIVKINSLKVEDKVRELHDEFSDVFEEGIGTYKGEKMKLDIKQDCRPKFVKSRPIPFALKDRVSGELDRLVEQGILTPVKSSEWATPIVPVFKSTGKLRICGDYKITINPVLEIDRYPLPRIEEMFAKLEGGEKFTKIDLKQAYQQVMLDDKSKKLLTINTHKGLFQYERVPFGISSAPGMFQRTMEQVVGGIDGVLVFIDDILVTGKNNEEHLLRLKTVLSRLQEKGLRVQRDKCEFFKDSISYLGYVIDSKGLHAAQDKVEAIKNAPEPIDKSQVQSFLGLVNYYGKFIPNMATICHPLYQLLKADVHFQFDGRCKRAFKEIKDSLTGAEILVHYNPESPVKLSCDASSYGVGAVLAHVFPDGTERPIAYASKTLTKAEKGYSQTDKEALAIIFGVKRFDQYLIGRHFTLATDHKPLLAILGPKKGLPVMSASRLQRYAIYLSSFTYDIVYVKGSRHCNADGLSRLPIPNDTESEGKEIREYSYLHYCEQSQLPIRAVDIKQHTIKDETLSKVMKYVMCGWEIDDTAHSELKSYKSRQNEITVEQGCLMWGHRIIIPETLKEHILKELHSSHFGVVRMKAMARSFVWWPKIDSDIEMMVRECEPCNLERPNPARSELHVWPYPGAPWQRIHVDFLEIRKGLQFLLVIDSYSKWVEVMPVTSTSAEQTIAILRSLFARHGLPETLVSDGGPPFTSAEFEIFMRANGVSHVLSPPYHPPSNGAAENAVKTFKNKLKTILRDGENLLQALDRFLIGYRNSVHSTTKETPAKLMFGRNLKTRLDLLRPNLKKTVEKNQNNQIRNFGGRKTKEFIKDQKVFVRDYRHKDKWDSAKVIKKLGSVVYEVELSSGLRSKRHIDQMQFDAANSEFVTQITKNNDDNQIEQHNGVVPVPVHQVPTSEIEREFDEVSETNISDESVITTERPSEESAIQPLPSRNSPLVRKSTRIRKPVDRLNL